MPSSNLTLSEDDRKLLLGLWVKHKRLIDVADAVDLSERQTARRLKAAGVELPGRGRPKGAKDSPWCDRQQNKRTRASECEGYALTMPKGR
jgi:hypothetical protein